MWNDGKCLILGLILLSWECALSQDRFIEGTDLTTPRIDQSSVTIWYNNQAYRHCDVLDVSLDGNSVEIRSGVKTIQVQWDKLTPQDQLKLSGSYELCLKRKKAAQDLLDGIIRLDRVNIFSISTLGPLFKMGDQVGVISGLPIEKKYADGETISCVRVKISPDTYQYETATGRLVTARVYKYVGSY